MACTELSGGVHTDQFCTGNRRTWAVADPGFPKRGRQPQGGRQPIIWPNFSQKLHENERNRTERGHTSLAPPLGSANDGDCAGIVLRIGQCE